MFRSKLTRGGVAFAAATMGVATMSMAFAGTAGATGTATGRSATLIIGSGSQTSYDEMTALSTLFNSAPGCDLTASTAVPASLDCGQASHTAGTVGGEQGYDVSAENPYNDFAVQAPAIGSGNGSTALEASGSGSPTQTIDFARASSAKGTSVSNRVKFATDAVSWVTFNAVGGVKTNQAKITNMTTAQLQGIFQGTGVPGCVGGQYSNMDWYCLGAKAHSPIDVYMAQTGSGTYSTWQSFTGITSNTAGGGVTNAGMEQGGGTAASHSNLFENQMSYISQQSDAADAIYFFSLGKFTTNCHGKNGKKVVCAGTAANDYVTFGSINGISATQSTVQGTGGGAGVTFPVVRGLYNNYLNSSAAHPSSQATLNFVSEKGFLCKSGTSTDTNPYTGNSYRYDIEAAIKAQGFFPLDVSGSPFAQGTVTNPAVITDTAFTAIDGDGTSGYCLVTHG